MPTLTRVCFRCHGTMKLRTIVPAMPCDALITYSCEQCGREEVITINEDALSEASPNISEYIPATVSWH